MPMQPPLSILNLLKQHFGEDLHPGLTKVMLTDTPEGLELVYELCETRDCTVTYRYKVYMWYTGDDTFTREEMQEMGWSEDALDQISDETMFSEYEVFISNYVYGEDVVTLFMNTNLFTEAGGRKILQQHNLI